MMLEKERFRKILGLILIIAIAYVNQHTCQIQYYWQKAKCQYLSWVMDMEEEQIENSEQKFVKTLIEIIF